MPSIFLSYAVSDEPFVSRLLEDLKTLDVQTWQDCINTIPKKPLHERLLSAQNRIDFIVLIFSSASSCRTEALSDWNDAIIDQTLHGRNWIIPILVEDCDLPEYILPDSVEDFRNPSTYSSAFEKLLTRMGLLNQKMKR